MSFRTELDSLRKKIIDLGKQNQPPHIVGKRECVVRCLETITEAQAPKSIAAKRAKDASRQWEVLADMVVDAVRQDPSLEAMEKAKNKFDNSLVSRDLPLIVSLIRDASNTRSRMGRRLSEMEIEFKALTPKQIRMSLKKGNQVMALGLLNKISEDGKGVSRAHAMHVVFDGETFRSQSDGNRPVRLSPESTTGKLHTIVFRKK